MTEITIDSKRYEDSDDCLLDAARDYAAEHGLEAWQVEARWPDYRKNRDEIVLIVR